ncbi:MAG: rRNA maturation RNase YbeY [Clostridia bacterium]|nr:rRNA maturation RNase YbeY [Clostridia bacterium]
MRENFALLCEEEEFSLESVQKMEKSLHGLVKSDVLLCFELVFVGQEEIRRLNKEMRGIDRVTDVLSFPALDGIFQKPIRKKDFRYELDEEGRLIVGSIALCKERAAEQAKEYGHSYERELNYLIVHGVLHCLGYDHEDEKDKKVMREKEEEILLKMGITRQGENE